MSYNQSSYLPLSSISIRIFPPYLKAMLFLTTLSLISRASLEEEIDILYTRLSTSVIVDHDGNCTWLAPVTLLSQCKINVRRFPFDEQVIMDLIFFLSILKTYEESVLQKCSY